MLKIKIIELINSDWWLLCARLYAKFFLYKELSPEDFWEELNEIVNTEHRGKHFVNSCYFFLLLLLSQLVVFLPSPHPAPSLSLHNSSNLKWPFQQGCQIKHRVPSKYKLQMNNNTLLSVSIVWDMVASNITCPKKLFEIQL